MNHQWLVSGVGRSGTTALYAFLCGLSRKIEGEWRRYYEPYLWGARIWNAEFEQNRVDFGSTSALHAEGVATHLITPLFLKGETSALHDEFADSIFGDPGRSVVAKFIRACGRLDYFLARFPALKIVHIIRNPMDCINSQMGVFSYFGEEYHPSDKPRLASECGEDAALWATECAASAAWWRLMNNAALKARDAAPDRVLVVPFEAIKFAPRKVCDKLAAFLGVSSSATNGVGFEKAVGHITHETNLHSQDVAILRTLTTEYFDALRSISSMSLGFSLEDALEEVLLRYEGAPSGAFSPPYPRDATGLRIRRTLAEEQRASALASAQVHRLEHRLAEAKQVEVALSTASGKLQREVAALKEKIAEYDYILSPRLRTLIELRPIRHILAERRRLKNERGLSAVSPDDEFASANVERIKTASPHTAGEVSGAATTKRKRESIYDGHRIQKPLGIAVFAYDREDVLANTLESLRLQDAIRNVTVFVDGDQGRPEKRAEIDRVESTAKAFGVADVKRNRGHFGFRKMMIVAMKEMMADYERILFLEDDCFPTGAAAKGFSQELDLIEDDPKTFSVYGHPFLVPGEGDSFSRFQGWGWATTRTKLEPVWKRLLECYLMSERQYLSFVRRSLSAELRAKINVTPGRQPSDTLERFFAWDETVCLLTAMSGMRHRRSKERIIYNCGAGRGSTHFAATAHYRRPPFNMIAPDEVWRYY